MRTGGGWGDLAFAGRGGDAGRLELYARELERWNRAIRLVGPRDLGGVRAQIADALIPFLRWPPDFPLLDIGSGAGLPGIAIAVAYPEGAVVCMEARGKRVSFLRHMVRTLGLSGVEVVEGRAEVVVREAPRLAGGFATVTARGVSEPKAFLGLAGPFLQPGGRAVLLRAEPGTPRVEGWEILLEAGYEGPVGLGPRSVAMYRRSGGEGEGR